MDDGGFKSHQSEENKEEARRKLLGEEYEDEFGKRIRRRMQYHRIINRVNRYNIRYHIGIWIGCAFLFY